MAGRRLSMLKSLCKSTNCSPNPMSFQLSSSYGKFVSYADSVLVRPSYAFVNRGYHTKETESHKTFANTQIKELGSGLLVNTRCYGTKPITAFSPTLSSSLSRCAFPPVSISPILGCRSYSSFFGSNADKDGQPGVPAASSGSEVDVGNSGVGGSDLVDKVKEFVQSAADAVTHTGQKAKEASSEIFPYVQQLLDAYPHLRNVVTPVGCTLAGTIFAWLVMPRLFRRFHKYASLGRTALLSGSLEEQVPYEKSFWGALEDPVRYLFTFMAFSQIGTMVAPTAIAAQYLAPAWRGAAIISFVWFLYRWKTNVYTRALATKSLPSSLDREKLLALDKISSVGLFMIGIMALAEACGVAVQSIMTVGGIGGVATAFAARDVLGNVLSGLSMQFTKPFSLGDTIKAGSIEGQVVDMGLTTTSLLNAEKFPVIVPNSLFSSQVIVNKSRAQWRGVVTRIPLQINDDLDKVPQISDDIKSMLRSHPKVFLGKEVPYCFLSRLESSFGELTLGCNLKQMSKDELFSTEMLRLLVRSHQTCRWISTSLKQQKTTCEKKANDFMGKIKSFKQEFSFDERLEESKNIIGKYPDRVPVIIERYSRTDLPEMEKKKYLVPRDMSVGQFIHILSSRLQLTPGKALFVFVKNTLPQTASHMDSIYESYKEDDGFLYMCYSSEKTFG